MLTATTSGLSGRAMLLSTLLAHPIQNDQLWQIRNENFGSQWDRGSAEAQRALALLRESSAAREDIAKLENDFDRLFVGAPPRVNPRESAYRPDVDPGVLQRLYEESGITMPWDLPPDHIACELSYVAQLPLVSPAPAHQMAVFVSDHLRAWAPLCLGEISMRAGSLLYQGIGALGMDYIESLPVR